MTRQYSEIDKVENFSRCIFCDNDIMIRLCDNKSCQYKQKYLRLVKEQKLKGDTNDIFGN